MLFRGARFEIRELLDEDRRRHDEWKNERERRIKAKSIDQLLQPRPSPVPLSYREIVSRIVKGLGEKSAKYGRKICSGLDALVYVDLQNGSLDPASQVPDLLHLREQGWRSVCMLMPPVGHVLHATDSAPEFLHGLVCQTKSEWADPDKLFTLPPEGPEPS